MRRDLLLGVLVVAAAEALIRGVVGVIPASGTVELEPLTPTALGVRRVLGPLPPPLLPLRYRTATARPLRPVVVPWPQTPRRPRLAVAHRSRAIATGDRAPAELADLTPTTPDRASELLDLAPTPLEAAMSWSAVRGERPLFGFGN